MLAVRTLAVGLAILVISRPASASLVYTIERTDSTFTSSLGGYTVTSASASATDTIVFNFLAGTPVVSGGVLSTIGPAKFGLTAAQAANLTVSSSGNAIETPSTSELVDNETEIDNNGSTPGTLYFRVKTSQNLFTLPNSNPLAFDITLTQQTALNGSTSAYQATITTGGGGATLGFINPSPGTAGPVLVANPTHGAFTVSAITHLTVGAKVGNTAGKITATGQANINAVAPEPSSLAMAGIGLVGVLFYGRRKARS